MAFYCAIDIADTQFESLRSSLEAAGGTVSLNDIQATMAKFNGPGAPAFALEALKRQPQLRLALAASEAGARHLLEAAQAGQALADLGIMESCPCPEGADWESLGRHMLADLAPSQ